MGKAATTTRPSLLPKTTAKELFCVTDKELEALDFKERKNRYNKRTPTKLYNQEEVAQLALEKFGGEEGLQQARDARLQKRQKRAEAHAGAHAEVTPPSTQSDASVPSTSPCDVPSGVEPMSALHPFIAERIQDLRPGTSGNGHYVMYWMRTGVRVHENPALDVARHEARVRGLPLLVCAFMLTETHPHPTHRRMKFFLEGLRDVQLELKAMGELLHVFVERHTTFEPTSSVEDIDAHEEESAGQGLRGQATIERAGEGETHEAESAGQAVSGQAMIQQALGRGPGRGCRGWAAILHTASGAALVITEEMPVEPEVLWSKRLAADLPQSVAMWAVDTACLVPMRLFKKPYEKAYAYRSVTEKMRGERLRTMPYHDDIRDWDAHYRRVVAAAGEKQSEGGASPGWQGLNLLDPHLNLAGLLMACPGVDSSVGGVDHMVGGSRQAYLRWESFRRNGLDLYAARRNNAMNRDGVSRLSAYHRFGMISPFKVARDSLLSRSNGARKFGDEFLTWREVAYTWCFHHLPAPQLFNELPKWAQQTLNRHAADPRVLKSQEEIEAAVTGDLLWDAMQHQLVTTGELHNNARMTWGKALLLWTPDPVSALNVLIHINNKYSLDGCDPASYGGVMWCFGLFDGPKAAESTPIYGSLRQRSTASIARRLNAAAFRALAVQAANTYPQAPMEAGQRTLDAIFSAARQR